MLSLIFTSSASVSCMYVCMYVPFPCNFFEASRWPSDHTIRSRPHIGQPPPPPRAVPIPNNLHHRKYNTTFLSAHRLFLLVAEAINYVDFFLIQIVLRNNKPKIKQICVKFFCIFGEEKVKNSTTKNLSHLFFKDLLFFLLSYKKTSIKLKS